MNALALLPLLLPQSYELISVNNAGEKGNGASGLGAITPNGRHVAFYSYSTNLDPNGVPGIFMRDRRAGTTALIIGADASCMGLSADANLLLFASYASDLVPNDANEITDVFVRNIAADTTTCVSVRPDGIPCKGGGTEATISANGRYVAFYSESRDLTPEGQPGVFVRDLVLETTRFVGEGTHPTLAAGGRYVAYVGDSPQQGVHRFDLRTGNIDYASVLPVGLQPGYLYLGCISPSGRHVAFINFGPPSYNPIAYLRDMELPTAIHVGWGETYGVPCMSTDGSFLALNIIWGVLAYDTETHTATQVSQVFNGTADGWTAWGRELLFATNEPDLDPRDTMWGNYDVYVWFNPTAPGQLSSR